jgi:hypothetical protein
MLFFALLAALSEPDQALRTIEQQFAVRPRAESEAALVALAGRWPDAPAAGRALIWLGGLALGDGRLDAAADRFATTRQRFSGELRALAERGLGDVALHRGHFSKAAAFYGAGLSDAEAPSLRFELDEKLALAKRLHRRWLAELAAWLGLVLALAWLGRGLRRPLRLPAETLYVLPFTALMAALSWPRDHGVFVTLAWLGGGALVICTVAFAGSPAPGGRRRLALDLTAATVANLALGYIALRRGGIIDSLTQSL